MHPLDLYDQWRRRVLRWLPIRQAFDRTPDDVAPHGSEDWLLEPIDVDEACRLFPHLEKDRAVLQYQRLRLQIREQDGRGF
ncbi:hypothetical protein ACLM44_03580 [Synechococcus sp. W2B2]|uniref:hypothetical protein n=1 Tax=unclassified Synechococcus TaxID=2626047 RepID=UPI00006B0BF0|nr:hypothetical protein [Synechococcus sp. WH 7805]EAR18925.1 hypothetical protein WH7805_03782 [Synechococcus sp. WH 7805]